MKISTRTRRRLARMATGLMILGAVLGVVAWYKLFRVVPQPERITGDPEMNFKYGSLGAEQDRGIPYWIWHVLPQIFPDLLPGPGGYASLGIPWEPGEPVPAGFALKTVGFPRVTNNCAICHTAVYRKEEGGERVFVAAGPGNQSNVQANLRFMFAAAKDPRWNADNFLREITQAYELSFLDQLMYRYLLVPLTRQALLDQAEQFEWMERDFVPDWGPGRDDPMNLTKYFMTEMGVDQTVGQADFPSIWNLGIRKGEGLYLNWSGDTPAVRSVLIDSALGLGAPPTAWFLQRMEDLDHWLSELPPPEFPFDIDRDQAARGEATYKRYCADCHDPGGTWTNKVLPMNEIGTDPERMETWTQAAADEANQRVRQMGIVRPEMVKQFGYLSPPLDGIWLRAPYLHHGTVRTMRDLLTSEDQRPTQFYRGYDVYDPVDMGFKEPPPIRIGPPPGELEQPGFLIDTRERGNGAQGHSGARYGTELSEVEKDDLIEYLKTL